MSEKTITRQDVLRSLAVTAVAVSAIILLAVLLDLAPQTNRVQTTTRTLDQVYSSVVVVNDGGSGTIIKTWKEPDGRNGAYILTGYHCTQENKVNLAPCSVGVIEPVPETEPPTPAPKPPLAVPVPVLPKIFEIVIPIEVRPNSIDLRYFDIAGNVIEQIQDIEATLVEGNQLLDYAILEIKTEFRLEAIPVVRPNLARHLLVLDKVYSVGYPSKELIWVSAGNIATNLGVSAGTRVPAIGHTAHIYYGNSGGPLLNDRFEQVGINIRIMYDDGASVPTMSYAVPLWQVYGSLGPQKTAKYFGFPLDK